jgi:stage II sporulation protein D
LKAQAVACRTYAVYKAKNCAAHEGGGQLCTSSAHCQAYADFSKISAERMEIAKRAVDETKGIIMTYGGEPVLAVFHAASVESTRSSAEVWGGQLPYLVSVKTDESAFMNVKERRGHGVGMSQYGAECLASKGYDFYSILSHYYTGVEFSSV